jgi:LAO/AO transport system kinase
MEIADIFVINKADRDGARKLYKETLNMLDSGHFPSGWRPPIMMLESCLEPHSFASAVEQLCDKIEEHHRHLVENNQLQERATRKVITEINDALRSAILEPVLNELAATGEFDIMVKQLMAKETDPYSLAEEIAKRYMNK